MTTRDDLKAKLAELRSRPANRVRPRLPKQSKANGATPPDPIAEAQEPPEETIDEAIARLSALPVADYDKARKAEATRLGIRKSTLDKMVAEKRAGSGSTTLQGKTFAPIDPEPWAEAVNAKRLLDDLSAEIPWDTHLRSRRYSLCSIPGPACSIPGSAALARLSHWSVWQRARRFFCRLNPLVELHNLKFLVLDHGRNDDRREDCGGE